LRLAIKYAMKDGDVIDNVSGIITRK
jgi:hypothetical protein